jgi:hypothetical protein
MLQAWANATNPELAAGLSVLGGKLYGPLFNPFLNALKGVKDVLLAKGGQTADQLLLRVAGTRVKKGDTVVTRRLTDGARSVNQWLKDSQENVDESVNIFPEDILVSEQFTHPFEFGNDPASPYYARNAQRMLVYTNAKGKVQGMLITGAEAADCGTMIKSGAMQNAYLMNVQGQIDRDYLPPSCQGGELPAANTEFQKIQAQCSRFALYMQIYNGSVNAATVREKQETQTLFEREIGENSGRRQALKALLGAKTPDSTWVDTFAAMV